MSAGKAQSLDGIHLLRSLAPDERDALARQCRWRRVRHGSFVFERDSENNDIIFLVSGKLDTSNYRL